MRIGEIAVLSSEADSKKKFIESACEEVHVHDDALIFGKRKINDQLVVHLYGLGRAEQYLNAAWDLVSMKLLGYIIIFNWNDPISYASAKSTIDFLTKRYDMPLVIAANLGDHGEPVPINLINAGINIDEQNYFTFCRMFDPDSVKKVLLTLMNAVIERLNQH